MRPLLWSSVLWLFVSCGSDYSDEGYQQQPPPPPVTKPPVGLSFEGVKPILDKDCGGCHNGRVHPLKFDSEAAFRGSRAKARILNGSMPPNGPLAPADKKALLDFLNA